MKKQNSLLKIKREWKNIIFNLIFAGLNLLLVIIFYKNILLTSIFIGVMSVIGLVKWKSKITLLTFIFSGLFFTIVEMIAINNKVWSYSVYDFFNVPIWLFFLWGDAAAFIYQMAIELKHLGVKK